MKAATLFERLHLRATQIATLNFCSQEENQIIGPLEGRKDGRYVSPELWTGKGPDPHGVDNLGKKRDLLLFGHQIKVS